MHYGNNNYKLKIDDDEIILKNIKDIVEYINKKIGYKLITRDIISNKINNKHMKRGRYNFFTIEKFEVDKIGPYIKKGL